jgi:hypothetical protein
MFIGSAGTGKSVLISNRLDQCNAQHFMISTIALNCMIVNIEHIDRTSIVHIVVIRRRLHDK